MDRSALGEGDEEERSTHIICMREIVIFDSRRGDTVQKTIMKKRKKKKTTSTISRLALTRDTAILTWIHTQKVATTAQIHRVTNLHSRRPIGKEGFKELLRRWRRNQWLKSKYILGHVWVSPTEQAKEDFKFIMTVRMPSVIRLRHHYFVNEFRLWAEERAKAKRKPLSWTSERELRYQAQHRKQHYPDGAITFDGKHIVIEVEISEKPVQRLRTIIADLAEKHPAVWYIIAPTLYKRTKRIIFEVPSRARIFEAYDLGVVIPATIPELSKWANGD